MVSTPDADAAAADPAPLGGLRVLEMASFACGPFCGKLLSDLGAEVIKIEPPAQGDRVRRYGPFAHDLPDPDGGLLHLYVNQRKRSVTLNLDSAGGRELLHELAATADAIIADETPAALAARGLSVDELQAAAAPSLVWVSITPFGDEGPWSGAPESPLTTLAASGGLYVQPDGYLNRQYYGQRPPVKWGGFASEFMIAVHAATAAMAALFARDLSGEGQRVEVSKQEALMHLVRHDIDMYPVRGVQRGRAGKPGATDMGGAPATGGSPATVPIRGTMECKDGHVAFWPMEPDMVERLVKLLGDPQWSKEPWFEDPFERTEHGPEMRKTIDDWLVTLTKDEIYELEMEHGIAMSPVLDIPEVATSPQLQSRRFFKQIRTPSGESVPVPGLPFPADFSDIEDPQAPAPRLGEHTRDVLATLLGRSDDQIVRLYESGIV